MVKTKTVDAWITVVAPPDSGGGRFPLGSPYPEVSIVGPTIVNPTAGSLPLSFSSEVVLSDSSTQNPLSYEWTFQGVNNEAIFAASRTKSITAIYPSAMSPGSHYTLQLTAISALNQETMASMTIYSNR